MIEITYGDGTLAHYVGSNFILIKEVAYPRQVGDKVIDSPPSSDEVLREIKIVFNNPESINPLLESLIEVQGNLFGFPEKG